MIEIDGSSGEGGGQILRTALSLSCLLNKPFRIYNIRKGRAKPGLMPQHLVSVRAAQRISRAEASGDRHGSTELFFSPQGVQGGDYSFDIGTAGSTSLVLQTIAPALIFCTGKSTVTLRGGTHVPFSPSFHYLAGVFAPSLRTLGIDLRLEIETYGFYPKGGGLIRAGIWPARGVLPLREKERGGVLKLDRISAVGNLPLSIAERQKQALLGMLSGGIGHPDSLAEIGLHDVPTPGQGTFVFLRAESANVLAGFTALGARGKRAETVGEEAAREFIAYRDSGAPLDPHLADQLVLYLSLCEEGSVFITSCITRHLLTNLWAIGRFHDFRFSVEGEVGRPGRVTINE